MKSALVIALGGFIGAATVSGVALLARSGGDTGEARAEFGRNLDHLTDSMDDYLEAVDRLEQISN